MDQSISDNQEVVLTPAEHQRVIDILFVAFESAIREILKRGDSKEE